MKPRRNSRRGPASARPPREDRAGAELAARLEREDHAAGRRSRDEVDVVAPSSPGARRPERAQLARRRRVLEDLELLEVGVGVAAALEGEVAVAQGAARAEQRLGTAAIAARAATSRVRRIVVIAGILAAAARGAAQRARASSSEPQPRGRRRRRRRARRPSTGPAPTIASHTPRFARQTRTAGSAATSVAAAALGRVADRRRAEGSRLRGQKWWMSTAARTRSTPRACPSASRVPSRCVCAYASSVRTSLIAARAAAIESGLPNSVPPIATWRLVVVAAPGAAEHRPRPRRSSRRHRAGAPPRSTCRP